MSPRSRTERVLAVVFVALLALLLAVLECFYVNARAGTTPVPVVQVVTPLANLALPWLICRAAGSDRVGPIPVLIWMVVALLFASSGPGGDVVVPGNWQGVTFLVLGAGGAVVGVLLTLRRRIVR